jgi:hypothetical protein
MQGAEGLLRSSRENDQKEKMLKALFNVNTARAAGIIAEQLIVDARTQDETKELRKYAVTLIGQMNVQAQLEMLSAQEGLIERYLLEPNEDVKRVYENSFSQMIVNVQSKQAFEGRINETWAHTLSFDTIKNNSSGQGECGCSYRDDDQWGSPACQIVGACNECSSSTGEGSNT